jgi:hypothetical protein
LILKQKFLTLLKSNEPDAEDDADDFPSDVSKFGALSNDLTRLGFSEMEEGDEVSTPEQF